MKAAVLTELGKPLEIVNGLEIPALQTGQVLVKLAYSGVCHSQLMEARGRRGPDPYLPHLLGHEGSGTVEAVGPGVTKVQPGDAVILGWIRGTGLNAPGAQYRKGSTVINSGAVTTFSDYSVVAENRCVKKPDGLPMELAVLFGCAIPTGAGMVINEVKPSAGHTIAIWGLGGVGMSALIGAIVCNASKIIAVDIDPGKLQLASELGATAVIDARRQDALAAIRDMTGGQGVDFSVEAAGRVETIEQAFQSVHKGGGLCVFASHPRFGDRIKLDPFDLICGKRIAGSWGGAVQPDRDVPRFYEMISEKRVPLEKLLTHRYRLEQINQALDDLEQGRVGRALVEMAAGPVA